MTSLMQFGVPIRMLVRGYSLQRLVLSIVDETEQWATSKGQVSTRAMFDVGCTHLDIDKMC